MGVVETVKRAIQSSGLSPWRIEQEIQIGDGSLSRFVQGRGGIKATTLERLCEFFGYTLKKSKKSKIKSSYPGVGRPSLQDKK